MNAAQDLEVLERALEGGHAVLPELIDRWTPVIQARVVKVLRRRASALPDQIFQEVEELVQQVFLSLFEKDAASLRAWSPERGLSLDNWVGLNAEQQVLAVLRTQKRNPWTEETSPTEELDGASQSPSPEQETLSKDTLQRLLDRLQERVSPLGWRVFCLLYLEGQDVEGTARGSGLTPTAVYAWRSRLRKVARELRECVLGACQGSQGSSSRSRNDGSPSETSTSSHKTVSPPTREVTP